MKHTPAILLAASAAVILLGAGCAKKEPAQVPAETQPIPSFTEPTFPPLPNKDSSPSSPPTAADAVPNIPIPPIPDNTTPSEVKTFQVPPIPSATTNIAPRTITITAQQWAFVPNQIHIKKDEAVVLAITSTDVNHGIFIPALGINEFLEPGKTVHVKITPQEKGIFPMICNVLCGAGHNSMRGEIIVE